MTMAHDDTSSHIWASLRSNILITIAKLAAAAWTRSGAMLAEGIHTGADTVNLLLLFQGLREASKPPDEEHPLGHGRSAYFWSFMVALFMFLGGSVFAVYEGIQHIVHPEPVRNLPVAIGILGLSLLLDCWITYGNIREFNRRRGTQGFVAHLLHTKDSNLVVVFGENAAAVLGLAIALMALVLAQVTGDPRYDAAGTLLVGVVLIGVAMFLAVEIKSLLAGSRPIRGSPRPCVTRSAPTVVFMACSTSSRSSRAREKCWWRPRCAFTSRLMPVAWSRRSMNLSDDSRLAAARSAGSLSSRMTRSRSLHKPLRRMSHVRPAGLCKDHHGRVGETSLSTTATGRTEETKR